MCTWSLQWSSFHLWGQIKLALDRWSFASERFMLAIIDYVASLLDNFNVSTRIVRFITFAIVHHIFCQRSWVIKLHSSLFAFLNEHFQIENFRDKDFAWRYSFFYPKSYDCPDRAQQLTRADKNSLSNWIWHFSRLPIDLM